MIKKRNRVDKIIIYELNFIIGANLFSALRIDILDHRGLLIIVVAIINKL